MKRFIFLFLCLFFCCKAQEILIPDRSLDLNVTKYEIVLNNNSTDLKFNDSLIMRRSSFEI